MKLSGDALSAAAMHLKLVADRIKLEAQAAEATGRQAYSAALQAEWRLLEDARVALQTEVRAPSAGTQEKNFLFNLPMMQALAAGQRVDLGGGLGLVVDPGLFTQPPPSLQATETVIPSNTKIP